MKQISEKNLTNSLWNPSTTKLMGVALGVGRKTYRTQNLLQRRVLFLPMEMLGTSDGSCCRWARAKSKWEKLVHESSYFTLNQGHSVVTKPPTSLLNQKRLLLFLVNRGDLLNKHPKANSIFIKSLMVASFAYVYMQISPFLSAYLCSYTKCTPGPSYLLLNCTACS